MAIEFLPSITTTNSQMTPIQFNYIKYQGIDRFCFFPTCLKYSDRQSFYQKLCSLGHIELPLVHARHDFTVDEFRMFMDTFGTTIFNIHVASEYPHLPEIDQYRENIALENTILPMGNDIYKWKKICFDAAHYHAALAGESIFSQFDLTEFNQLLFQYPIVAAHISAFNGHEDHCYTELEQFSYLSHYAHLLPSICAMELENSIADQLTAISYLSQSIQGHQK